jgi:hypothetical protein
MTLRKFLIYSVLQCPHLENEENKRTVAPHYPGFLIHGFNHLHIKTLRKKPAFVLNMYNFFLATIF